MAKAATGERRRRGGPRNMSDQHKESLAEGREQGRIVRAYLEALEPRGTGEPGRRRRSRRSTEDIDRRLAQIEERIGASASVMVRLQLAQERIDLQAARLAGADGGPDMAAIEARFVKVAAAYSDRRGVSRAAWREAGVPTRVLKAAGVR